jgi:hypothetical protein
MPLSFRKSLMNSHYPMRHPVDTQTLAHDC